MRGRPAIIGVVILILAASLFAQASDSPSFDVASIKPSPGPPVASGGVPANRFRAFWQTLSLLIGIAYRTPDTQVVGGPAWVRSDRFDIEATTGGPATPEQRSLMLQHLLAERFKLVLHHEQRQQPIFALSVARGDRPLGHGLQPSAFNCETRADGAVIAPPPPEGHPYGCTPRRGLGTLVGDGMPISRLAAMLAVIVSRPTVDRTGLTGTFDVDLRWAPDPSSAGRGVGVPSIDPNDPSIFTAIQEQLGLKLESTTGPVDFLVIDHVEPPTPD